MSRVRFTSVLPHSSPCLFTAWVWQMMQLVHCCLLATWAGFKWVFSVCFWNMGETHQEIYEPDQDSSKGMVPFPSETQRKNLANTLPTLRWLETRLGEFQASLKLERRGVSGKQHSEWKPFARGGAQGAILAQRNRLVQGNNPDCSMDLARWGEDLIANREQIAGSDTREAMASPCHPARGTLDVVDTWGPSQVHPGGSQSCS